MRHREDDVFGECAFRNPGYVIIRMPQPLAYAAAAWRAGSGMPAAG